MNSLGNTTSLERNKTIPNPFFFQHKKGKKRPPHLFPPSSLALLFRNAPFRKRKGFRKFLLIRLRLSPLFLLSKRRLTPRRRTQGCIGAFVRPPPPPSEKKAETAPPPPFPKRSVVGATFPIYSPPLSFFHLFPHSAADIPFFSSPPYTRCTPPWWWRWRRGE